VSMEDEWLNIGNKVCNLDKNINEIISLYIECYGVSNKICKKVINISELKSQMDNIICEYYEMDVIYVPNSEIRVVDVFYKLREKAKCYGGVNKKTIGEEERVYVIDRLNNIKQILYDVNNFLEERRLILNERTKNYGMRRKKVERCVEKIMGWVKYMEENAI